MKKAVKITFKILLWIVVGLLLIAVLVQTPPVQNFARKKVQAWLQNKLGTRFEIGHLHIGFPSSVVLDRVYLEDKTKDTLLYGGRIKVSIKLFKLLQNEVQIGDLRVQNMTAKIKRQLPDTTFNFQFLIDAFTTQNSKPANPADTASLKMDIDNLYLDDIRFIYRDTISGNDWSIQLHHFDSHIKKFDPQKQVYDVPEVDLDGLTARLYQYKPLVTATDIVNNDTGMAPMPAINLRQVQLKNVDVDYQNNVSALYTRAKVKNLETRVNTADLNGRRIILDQLQLLGAEAKVLMGKTAAAKQVAEKAKTEARDVVNQRWLMKVHDVNVQQTSFQFDDENQPRQPKAFDYGHLKVEGMTVRAGNISIDDSITASVQEAAFKEQSGFTLQQLQGDFIYTDKKVYADNFLVQTPNTRIKHTIHLDYPSLEAIQKDIGSLQVKALLPGCAISSRDILYFVPDLRSQPIFSNPATVFTINADVWGRVDHLTARVLRIEGWNNTKIDVAGTIVGLPSIDKLYGDVTIKEIRTTRQDAAQFLPDSLRNQFELPATMQVTGSVKGNGKQLQTNVQVRTSSGNVALNGNMANYQDLKAASYNMQLQAQQVQAGAILKNPDLQTVSANLQVQGKGLTQQTADATLKGRVQSVVYQQYNYQNIKLDAAIKDQQAKGDVSIADENIRLAGSISVNLALADPALTADIMVDSIKTKPLHLTTQEIIYRGKISADMPDINPDSLQGNLNIYHSLLVNGNERLQLDTVQLVANHSGDSSSITLQSDIARASLAGKYKLTQLGDVFSQALQPYFTIAPGQQRTVVTAPYNFRIRVFVKDNPALKLLFPTLQRFETLRMNARFASDSGWQANAQMPVLVTNSMAIDNLQFTAGAADSTLRLNTSVNQIQLGSNTIYNASVRANAAHDKVDFITRFYNRTGKIQFAVPGLLNQPQYGIYDISLKPDSLILNYDQWSVAPDNVIHIGDNEIRITNFMLNHNFQQISLKSRSNVLNAPVEASFTSFQIATLAAFATSDSLGIDGTLDGDILLHNLTTSPVFSGNVTVNNLHFKEDTVGNIIVKANNTTPDDIKADILLTGRGNHATVNGDFYLKPVGGNDFRFKVAIDTLNLATIEGATMGAIKNASGQVTGKFDVSGTFSKPNIDGGMNFKQTSFNVSMLNNYLHVEDETIAVNNQGIKFDSFIIEDSAKNKATIDGMIYTTDFSKYRFDLSVRANNFQAMNSTKKENSLYYGKLIFSSNMKIKGTAEQPVVDGSITIGDKTNLTVVLPQQDPTIVKREGIVQFVDMDAPENDTLFVNKQARFDSLNKSSITGLDISANVEIKKEAVFSLVVDEGNGDFIRMQGEGLLTGGIDPSGKTTLAGSYEITGGSYELNYNMLRRKFEIQKGSKIVWNGEPTKADLNVTAVYTVKAAPLDLVKDQVSGQEESARNTYLQRIPFNVLLKLEGELLQPRVSFDIVLPEESHEVARGNVTTINYRLALLRQESSELNKQVFSLLLLGRFMGENPFESSTGGVTAEDLARQSASRLLTEQLNKLASDLVQGVDINFDVASYDDYSTGTAQTRTDMNVALSKRLLNDRLTVTVGSNFELEGTQNTNRNTSNIAGNASVEYSLSKDRRYVLKAYRKNEYEGVIEGYVIETGVGFVITLDYNKFKYLFMSKKAKEEMRRKRRQAQEAEQANPPATPPQQTSIPPTENRELNKRDDI